MRRSTGFLVVVVVVVVVVVEEEEEEENLGFLSKRWLLPPLSVICAV